MDKRRSYLLVLSIIALIVVTACSGEASRGSNGGNNSNSGLNSSRIEQIFRRVFPASRTIDVGQINRCSGNQANYEAFVNYELYDNLYARYTTLSAWFVFWSPYDENSFFEGRCS